MIDGTTTGLGTGTVNISSGATFYPGVVNATFANNFILNGLSTFDSLGALRVDNGDTISGSVTLKGSSSVGGQATTGNVISGVIGDGGVGVRHHQAGQQRDHAHGHRDVCRPDAGEPRHAGRERLDHGRQCGHGRQWRDPWPATGTVGGTVAVNGTITGGLTAANTSSPGTLHTGVQTWNGSTGAYIAKVASINASSPSANVNDTLIMSGLTVQGGFKVSLLAMSGATPTFATENADTTGVLTNATPGSYIVLATDSEASSPFASPSAIAALNLNFFSGAVAVASKGDTIQLAGYADGNNYDLVAEDVASTPEPTSLMLAGLAAAPLALGRRRSRRAAASAIWCR